MRRRTERQASPLRPNDIGRRRIASMTALGRPALRTARPVPAETQRLPQVGKADAHSTRCLQPVRRRHRQRRGRSWLPRRRSLAHVVPDRSTQWQPQRTLNDAGAVKSESSRSPATSQTGSRSDPDGGIGSGRHRDASTSMHGRSPVNPEFGRPRALHGESRPRSRCCSRPNRRASGPLQSTADGNFKRWDWNSRITKNALQAPQ